MSMSSPAIGKVTWENRSSYPPNGGFFLVLPNKTILVGRDETRNHVAFADLVVSRCQLEIFSVVVDEQYDHPPLVFVRDRGSSNGTAVNGQLVGRGAALSPSRLLEDGDTITIGGHPHLRLEYTLLMNSHNWSPSYTLSRLQRREVELFKDRFVVTGRTISDGAHAIVFLATDVETGQHVVCKVHDISNYSRSSKEVERIRQEASLLSTLDHPNILPIKAAFETEQTIYAITDLATGGDLYSLLLRYNKLNDWGIRSIIRQILQGVAYIHSKGVAHRDIKLENILCGVTPQVPYRIMLSDFGDSGIAGRGRLKSKVGTRFYRPPYVISPTSGAPDLTIYSECDAPGRGHGLSVDIWAVGMLTLQLVLGYEELPGLDSVVFKSQADVDAYLGAIFAVLGPQGLISDACQSFICGCMAYDGDRRPTARQAFYHRWLQNPASDRKMFKRLEADNAKSWKPQRAKFPVIEDLRTTSLEVDEGGGAPRKGQVTLQDTASPHFIAHEATGAKQNHDNHS